MRCPDCGSTELVGSVNDWMCIKCGKEAQISRPDEPELIQAPERYQKKKDHDEIMLEIKDDISNCPRCESNNINIFKRYVVCKSCKYIVQRDRE